MWKPYPTSHYEGIFEQSENGEVRRVALNLKAIAPIYSFGMFLRDKYNYEGHPHYFFFNLKKEYLVQRLTDSNNTCEANILHNMLLYVENSNYTDEEVIDWMLSYAWNLDFAQIAEYFTVKLEEGDLRDKFFSLFRDKETVLSA